MAKTPNNFVQQRYKAKANGSEVNESESGRDVDHAISA